MDRCILFAYYFSFNSMLYSVIIDALIFSFLISNEKLKGKKLSQALCTVFITVLICIFYPLYFNDIEKYNLTYWAFAQRCLLTSLIPIGFGVFIIYKQKKMIEDKNSC